MPKRGRPKGSGNRSQLLIVMTLDLHRDGCSFEELVDKTGLHRNTIRPNIESLILKEWVEEKREGHKKVYRILGQDLLMKYFWNLGTRGLLEPADEKEISFRGFSEIGNQVVHKLSYHPIIDIAEIVDSEGHIIGKDNYIVDKELGLVTFNEQPIGKFRISYRAGYKDTPEDIQKASAKLVAGFLEWRVSIFKGDTKGINRIPTETLSEVLPLLSSFKKSLTDARIENLVISLANKGEKVKLLEGGVKEIPSFYSSLGNLPKWLDEMDSIKKEKQRIGSNSEWRRLRYEGSLKRQNNMKIKKR